jgi:large subunit ribosomal protein L17
LAKPRLGDAGVRAVLEFVGTHDRKRRKAARPAFESESIEEKTPLNAPAAENEPAETGTADDNAATQS